MKKQSLDNQSKFKSAIDAVKKDRLKIQAQELNEEIKRATNRGNTLLEESRRMNFLFIYGCRPSTGVKANTTMVNDIMTALIDSKD